MANIKYNPETEKGKEKLCSWVRGKKFKVTSDTFAEIFEIPREDNPEFEFPNVGMPDLAVVSQELLLERDERDGEAIGMGKTIDLPRMMFLSLCAAHTASNKRGLVPFMGSSLSRSKGQRKKRRWEAGAYEERKKRRWEAGAYEEPPMGMVELNEAIMNLGREMGAQMSEFKAEVNARMTSLEEESRCHMTMLQEMKGMMIQMEAEYDDEEEEEED
ncbi:hypothetical protein Acr_00g0062300 [Actinidia rufa]|uniref:Uncharacterized protein n=1 Tax=Actinidia rufa TaxID=165716 RepID=A0A7J0DNY6_9ERIC|nr:hypothetical protein Acr_00g0062300 [Actinidia rufa]